MSRPSSKPSSCARGVAAEVLARVIDQDAYAAPTLSAAMERGDLGPKDRALATELTYGVLRTEGYLRRRIARHAKLASAAPAAQFQLLLGVYQLDFLDRVPVHAVVSEAVRLTKKLADARAGGFVNAVLRNLERDREQRRLGRQDAIMASVPSFLRKRLDRAVGEEETVRLLCPDGGPVTTLRVRPGRTLDFPERHLHPLAGAAVRYTGGGDPRTNEGYLRGDFVVQEYGAQRIAELLAVRPGEKVLDVCAGRGQKSSLLVDQGGTVLSTDLHPHKLSQLAEEFSRLGLSCSTELHDWTQPPKAEWLGQFDAILVDAPCSGVGTLRRRPEILRRLTPETPRRLADLQVAILRQAALALAPGGRLLFATCSVLRDEGEEVVDGVRELLVASPWSCGELAVRADAGLGRLLPGRDETDGYFWAMLQRP